MRILIADDVPLVTEVLLRLLQRGGHEGFICNDGAQVVQQVELVKPDVLLLDIAMPEVDGFAIVNRLNDGAAFRPRKVIAVTGYDDPLMRAKIAAAGFDHHLVKPVDWPMLADAIVN